MIDTSRHILSSPHWQILDYNLFKPGQALQNGTFWLCEQVPGYIRSNDLSQLLQEQGYFGSCMSDGMHFFFMA